LGLRKERTYPMVSGTDVLEISAARELASWKKRFNKMTRPNHYSRWKIEPIEFIRANELDFYRANIIKYIMRHDAKDGLKDLEKALQYLQWYIEDMYPTEDRGTVYRAEVAYPITPIDTPFLKHIKYPVDKTIMMAEDLIAAERALYDEGWTS
jgi:hypothetical protein